jgi:hypothetical protein
LRWAAAAELAILPLAPSDSAFARRLLRLSRFATTPPKESSLPPPEGRIVLKGHLTLTPAHPDPGTRHYVSVRPEVHPEAANADVTARDLIPVIVIRNGVAVRSDAIERSTFRWLT